MNGDILGRWGTYIFVPQVLLGGAAYLLSPYFGFTGVPSIVITLEVIGGIAVLAAFIAMYHSMVIGALLALSSVAAILCVFTILAGADIFAGACSFMTFGLSFVAAKIIQRDGAPGAIESLTYRALPVFGSLLYLFERLEEECEKMMRR